LKIQAGTLDQYYGNLFTLARSKQYLTLHHHGNDYDNPGNELLSAALNIEISIIHIVKSGPIMQDRIRFNILRQDCNQFNSNLVA
jgi:hypothetical protein